MFLANSSQSISDSRAISPTNIKTLNNNNIIGAGNLQIQSGSYYKISDNTVTQSGISAIFIEFSSNILYYRFVLRYISDSNDTDFLYYPFRGGGSVSVPCSRIQRLGGISSSTATSVGTASSFSVIRALTQGSYGVAETHITNNLNTGITSKAFSSNETHATTFARILDSEAELMQGLALRCASSGTLRSLPIGTNLQVYGLEK